MRHAYARNFAGYAQNFFAKEKRKPRLLFIVTEDWYFVSHRLSLAKAIKEAGFDVAIACRVSEHRGVIQAAGLEVFPIDFDRGGLNPVRDLKTVGQIAKVYRQFRPDIAHHVALKPVLYGSLVARLVSRARIVNALGGLGYVFSSKSRRAIILRYLVGPILRLVMRMPNSRLIVQNEEDMRRVVNERISHAAAVRLIPGVGVELSRYRQADAGKQPPLVVLPARLLRDKGVGEFVEAARMLKQDGISARFALVGRPDPLNPASVTQNEVDGWVSEGIVEAWGWREDIPDVLAQAQIVCLPSHHEGLPKILLEAAASGCAMVATDIAGCRAVVRDTETGLLVPVGDVAALVAALRRMVTDVNLRRRCGANARARAHEVFSIESAIAQTFEIYSELLRH